MNDVGNLTFRMLRLEYPVARMVEEYKYILPLTKIVVVVPLRNRRVNVFS
jgi:hypothetical protein